MNCSKTGIMASAIALLPPLALAAEPSCNKRTLNDLISEFSGQSRGFESVVKLTVANPASCKLQGTYENVLDEQTKVAGKLTLALKGDKLEGKWASSRDSGRVRFVVRRGGQHLNGQMYGNDDRPSGPWDLIKQSR